MKRFYKLNNLTGILIVTAFLTVFSCKQKPTTNTNTEKTGFIPSIDKFHDGIHHWRLFHEGGHYNRYVPSDYTAIANNFIAYQNSDGGWPKNIDWLGAVNADSLLNTLPEQHRRSTLDNDNCYSQIEYLSQVYYLTRDDKYKQSAIKGINYILNSQNASGGWRGWDVDAITFNDQVMSGVMNLFLDILEGNKYYSWINDSLKSKIKTAYDRALSVTLKCQIVVNGEKTAWCQQHNHKTLKPIKARSFELPAITANESSDVLKFLMRIKNPNDSVKNAIISGVKWLKKSALHGIRLERVKIDTSKIIYKEYPYDLIVVHDSSASPIWARYYDIKTNTPFMCNRDGHIVYKLSDVALERRTGYGWYGYWPAEVVYKLYPQWLEENNIKSTDDK